MNQILIQILLVVAIITCILLIINLVRLYQILSDFSEASEAIKNTVNAISKIVTSWRQSAKSVGEFVGEVTNYVNLFKKLKGDREKEKDEQ